MTDLWYDGVGDLVPKPTCSRDDPASRLGYMFCSRLALALCVWLFCTASVGAVDIIVDYSRDAASDDYFRQNPLAKGAVDQAAADISEVITSSLTPIAVQDTVVGVNGSSTVSLAWQGNLVDPMTNATEWIDSMTMGANEVRIFVRLADINGMTIPGGDAVLGMGGSGGIEVSLSAQGFAYEWEAALMDVQRRSIAVLGRGAGPTIEQLVFPEPLGPGSPTLQVGVGAAVGQLTLDSDTDNDGRSDSPDQMASFWHLDHTTPVADARNDLYSVALHEILHAIGFGAADSWQSFAAGEDWSGAAASAANGGSGSGLLSPDAVHIASGILSRTIDEGQVQEPVMSPALRVGTRRRLTVLDLAFLRDLGWQTVSITPIGDFDEDGDLDVDDIDALTAGMTQSDLIFDLTEDGHVDFQDRIRWVAELRGTWFGDANLDNEFNSDDLIQVFQLGRFETSDDAGWWEGDWSGDGLFDSGDFVVAFQDGGFELGPRSTILAVPEATWSGHVLALWAWLLARRRRRTCGRPFPEP